MFFAKVVDLPTIIESLKTIDRKNFYKTADICQMMICKEEDDRGTSDEEEERLFKNKKDNKVDKKFLWPHGITPPMKNVRKRRFRKTCSTEHDIFGGAVSDSEEEEDASNMVNIMDLDEDNSRLSIRFVCNGIYTKVAQLFL
ncbi:transcription initiation factor TFIID subunit 7-like [Diaphorina citri]|uniref:Transcription initiation factor TFIID subunit 7-like n=1 Tax=Diaphorina citri TaxID=121845 RepID=A0A1S4EST6_DIACI|nr:transcription initiation factor TFIID subunit 7-like [Diaphorina citri]